MSGDLLQRLRDAADKEDTAALVLAHNGRIAAMQAYQTKPGKQTKEDMDAAQAFYYETVGRLTARYLPEEAAAPEGERFANRKQALDWLVAQGYKVSQGKFYQDCKAGFPALHRDGSVSRYQVMQYGQQLDVERRSVPENGDYSAEAEKLKTEKLRHEVAKLEAEARKEDERWLLKDDAWATLAAIVGTLRDSLRHHFHAGQGQLVHLAGGDVRRGPEVYEGCEEIMAKAFNEVCATGQIDGVFSQEEQQDAA
jgi:hypothetical protein